MKIALVLLFCAFLGLTSALDSCVAEKCKRPNCVCSSGKKPIENLPQLVMLSFDDSASRLVFDNLWKPVLFDRKNPDGCHIGGTFFVPHEYSDYEVVNMLYNKGFEIGSHSITKNALQTYWRNLSKNNTILEMGGQKTILSTFANIPTEEISGARIPLLEFNNNTFAGLKEAGFKYDNSWPTLSQKPYFPHTLDFKSDMPCFLSLCQAESVPGLFEVPIIDWTDMEKHNCNKLLACEFEGKEEEILNWMKAQFNASYNGERTPFSILINYAVFDMIENSLGAFKKFLDYLGTLKDVFLVNESMVLEWMKNPVTKDKFKSCVNRKAASCSPVTCQLQKEGADIRYMRSCVACPKKYPWLNNPTGKAN